jgi:hypothetical protein
METGTFGTELQEKWCGNKKTDQLPHNPFMWFIPYFDRNSFWKSKFTYA